MATSSDTVKQRHIAITLVYSCALLLKDQMRHARIKVHTETG